MKTLVPILGIIFIVLVLLYLLLGPRIARFRAKAFSALFPLWQRSRDRRYFSAALIRKLREDEIIAKGPFGFLQAMFLFSTYCCDEAHVSYLAFDRVMGGMLELVGYHEDM